MFRTVKEETRSVSPHCPKTNESEEPEGAAMEVAGAGKCVTYLASVSIFIA